MKRTAWIVLSVVLVLLGVLAARKYVLPTLVRAAEASRAKISAQVEKALRAQLPPNGAPPVNVPATATGASSDADRAKEATALQLSRDRAEKERRLAGDPTPRVDTIVAMTDDRFSVLIGGALVPEGAMVEGYRVRKITASSVEFEKDGQTWVQKID